MESRLRLLLVTSGLPRPQAQMEIRDQSDSFVARVDLCYPEAGLCIEYDGAQHRVLLAEDNRRQNKLIASGYQVLRFTAADVLQNPERVVALVRGELNGHRRRSFVGKSPVRVAAAG